MRGPALGEARGGGEEVRSNGDARKARAAAAAAPRVASPRVCSVSAWLVSPVFLLDAP